MEIRTNINIIKYKICYNLKISLSWKKKMLKGLRMVGLSVGPLHSHNLILNEKLRNSHEFIIRTYNFFIHFYFLKLFLLTVCYGRSSYLGYRNMPKKCNFGKFGSHFNYQRCHEQEWYLQTINNLHLKYQSCSKNRKYLISLKSFRKTRIFLHNSPRRHECVVDLQ
jgi:hypothetical protein